MAQLNGILHRVAQAARGAVEGGRAGYVKASTSHTGQVATSDLFARTAPSSAPNGAAAGLRRPGRAGGVASAPTSAPPLQYASVAAAKTQVQAVLQQLVHFKDADGPRPQAADLQTQLRAVINTPGLRAGARDCLVDIVDLHIKQGHFAGARTELSAALKLF
ncbi:MAG: hypothetical protein EOO40_13245 [Deltaproteobacteria bacterium]|nr:MAG: hypothetical protein EOO40_13245 [Deltaproteobacteria bacterium]